MSIWLLPGYHYNKKHKTSVQGSGIYLNMTPSSLGVLEETRSEENDHNVTDDVTAVNTNVPSPIRVLDVDTSEEGISRSVLAVVAVACRVRVLKVGAHRLSELAGVLSTGLTGRSGEGEELVSTRRLLRSRLVLTHWMGKSWTAVAIIPLTSQVKGLSCGGKP
jgi:hypothetical protein